ncbi:hypothetical protein OXX59_001493, partial [Metschnikowia pulcherrima]
MAKREAGKSSRRADKKAKAPESANNLLSENEITSLATETLEKSKYNNLVDLLAQYDEIESILKQEEDDVVEKSARHLTVSVYKCFEKLLAENTMDTQVKNEKKQLVAKWLQDKYEKFKVTLCRLIQTEFSFSSSLQLDALDLMFGLIKLEAQATKEFPVETYQSLVKSLLLGDCGEVLGDESSSNFLLL